MMNVLVIGCGAAGMAAACAAAETGARVTVLEAHRRSGRKILASGNGHCNLMNDGFAYCHGAALAGEVLSRISREDLRSFFERTGLPVLRQPREDGRYYPAVDQSAAVTDCLIARMRELRVRLIPGSPVLKIRPRDHGFIVCTEQEEFSCDRVLAAPGSPAGGNLGADAYSLLTDLGHTLVPPLPALCPLLLSPAPGDALKGLRFPAMLRLLREGSIVEMSAGEALVTQKGLSGICAMQLAGTAAELMRAGTPVQCAVDLSPLMDLVPREHLHRTEPPFPPADPQRALRLLESRSFLRRDRLLTGLLPAPLAQVLDRDRPALKELALRLTDLRLDVTGIAGESSQVIRGGIAADEWDPGTLESHLVPGLFAAGEILDVDGDCGGFNLMFAFASGILAGRSAGREEKS